ncbi:MAG: CAAX prenyl protease-related protein [Pirellulales bacterium]
MSLTEAFRRVPWLPYVLPLAVFLLISAVEPAADAAPSTWLPIAAEHYPLVYTAKIAAVIVALVLVWPVYRRFPLGVTPLGLLVGVVGGALWIGLCRSDIEEKVLAGLGLESWLSTGTRAAYNPLEALTDNPAWMYGFLAIRFLGLAVLVPIIEEFFLRGFLMRFVTATDWAKVPFGVASVMAIVVGTAFPVLSHPPSEALAVIVWFSLLTWLMLKTRNIWDCVAAHAVTNLMLGIYVVASGDWRLW